MRTTTLRLPDELHKLLKKEAEKRGMTFNGYLLGILWEGVKQPRITKSQEEIYG